MTRLILTLTALVALAACETVEGFGQDVQSAGGAIQQSSNEVQRDL